MGIDFLGPEFAEAMKKVGTRARHEALVAGLPVVYRDVWGCYVQELTDGRKFEIRFLPGAGRDQHIEVIRELTLAHSHKPPRLEGGGLGCD